MRRRAGIGHICATPHLSISDEMGPLLSRSGRGDYGPTTLPPVIACDTPVVPGNEMGKPLSVRTAR